MNVECEANVAGEILSVRLKLARGDIEGAVDALEKAEQFVRNHNILNQMAQVAVVKVEVLLKQGEAETADHLAQNYDLPLSVARARIALEKYEDALAILDSYLMMMKESGREDERLKTMILQAVALYAANKNEKAVQVLSDALLMAEPGGFIRIFLNEGANISQLLTEMASLRIMPEYIDKLLAAFKAEEQPVKDERIEDLQTDLETTGTGMNLVDPLSRRELEVLKLIAQGLSNHEICKRLFLSLSTVKGHNLRIFSKLQVERRTEAVARARELGIL
jgi:LuxR family maltose regulon positive regulatory protein